MSLNDAAVSPLRQACQVAAVVVPTPSGEPSGPVPWVSASRTAGHRSAPEFSSGEA